MNLRKQELAGLDKTVMPFGKYKGKTFDETPLPYLDWLHGQDLQEPLKSKLERYLSNDAIQRQLAAELEEDEFNRDQDRY